MTAEERVKKVYLETAWVERFKGLVEMVEAADRDARADEREACISVLHERRKCQEGDVDAQRVRVAELSWAIDTIRARGKEDQP